MYMSGSKGMDIDQIRKERNKEFPHMKMSVIPKINDAMENPVPKAKPDNDKPDTAKSGSGFAAGPLGVPEQPVDPDIVKTSEHLRHNVLPPMDQIYLIDYNLSLDIRNDSASDENHVPEYIFQFAKFGNISKIELISVIVSNHHQLLEESHLFVDIKELSGRCYLHNGKRTFGKIIQMAQKDGHLIYVPEECVQAFSTPISLDRLTVSICDHRGTPINIREIKVGKLSKTRNSDELVVECLHPHYLTEGSKIELQIIKPMEIVSYNNIEVKGVMDDRKFRIKNSFEELTNQMRIFRTNILISLSFKLSEINWFILDNRTVETSQIVKLSQLIKERNQSININD